MCSRELKEFLFSGGVNEKNVECLTREAIKQFTELLPKHFDHLMNISFGQYLLLTGLSSSRCAAFYSVIFALMDLLFCWF